MQKETAYARPDIGVLLIVIHDAPSYVGMVSGIAVIVGPAKDAGVTVPTDLTSSLLSISDIASLGVVLVITCPSVCTGLIGTCATYSHTRFRIVTGRTLSYRTQRVIFTILSFIVSNAELSAIIKVSVPMLLALYPVATALILLTLTRKSLDARFPCVYFWIMLLMDVASSATRISSLVAVFDGSIGWSNVALAMLPLQQYQPGWIVLATPDVAIETADTPRRQFSRSVLESSGRSVIAAATVSSL